MIKLAAGFHTFTEKRCRKAKENRCDIRKAEVRGGNIAECELREKKAKSDTSRLR